MRSVSSLTWIDTARANAPVSVYSVNFATDTSWTFNLSGSYLGASVAPRGVSIDNSQNTAVVTVYYGPVSASVNAYERSSLTLSPDLSSIVVSCDTAQTVQFTFYIDPNAIAQTQSQNIYAIQQSVQQAIASATLGTMQPIINGAFAVVNGTSPYTIMGASPWYFAAGWMLTGLQDVAVAGIGTAPLSQCASGGWFGRVAGKAAVNTVMIGSAMLSSDSAQFVGSTISLSFDVAFGADMATQTPLIYAVVGGTGTDQPIFPALSAEQIFGTGQLAYTPTAKRVTLNGNIEVPSSIKQIGVLFFVNPTGISGANEYVRISRVQVDAGQPQSYRPVPYALENARCETMLQYVNDACIGIGSASLATQAVIYMTYARKRIAPTIYQRSATFYIWQPGTNAYPGTPITAFNSQTTGPNSAWILASVAGGLSVGLPCYLINVNSGFDVIAML